MLGDDPALSSFTSWVPSWDLLGLASANVKMSVVSVSVGEVRWTCVTEGADDVSCPKVRSASSMVLFDGAALIVGTLRGDCSWTDWLTRSGEEITGFAWRSVGEGKDLFFLES